MQRMKCASRRSHMLRHKGGGCNQLWRVKRSCPATPRVLSSLTRYVPTTNKQDYLPYLPSKGPSQHKTENLTIMPPLQGNREESEKQDAARQAVDILHEISTILVRTIHSQPMNLNLSSQNMCKTRYLPTYPPRQQKSRTALN